MLRDLSLMAHSIRDASSIAVQEFFINRSTPEWPITVGYCALYRLLRVSLLFLSVAVACSESIHKHHSAG